MRYRALFQVASDALGVFSLGPDGQPQRFTEINNAACVMLGYTPEELGLLGPLDVIDPIEHERVPGIFRSLQDDQHQTFELLLVRKDGRRIPVEMSGTVLDLESTPTVLGVVHDIGGKKRAEDALRQATAATILASRKRARRDAVVMVSLFVLLLVLLKQFDLFETVLSWPEKLRIALAEDVVVALRLLVLLWVVYAFRRRRDSAVEVSARVRAEDALANLQNALESRIEARTEALCQANRRLQVEIGKHATTLEDLRHRESELREAQRIAGIGSWEWTIASGEIVWSEGLNRLLDHDRSSPAPTFEALPQFFSPESWERLAAAIARTIETGASYELETEMIRADGTTCWTTTRGEAIRGADGTVAKLHGTVHDITEHKALESLRLARELELEEAERIGGMGSYLWTPSTGAVYWSKGLKHILRYDVNRLPPTFETLSAFYTPESWARLMTAAARGLETGVPDELETEMIRADGTTCWTLTRGEAVRGPEGSVVTVRGTVHDIDARKRAERSVEQEKIFSDVVVQMLPGLFSLVDEHGRLLKWNKNVETVTGYSEEELALMSASDFFDEPDRSVIATNLAKAFAMGQVVSEASLVTKDQTHVPHLLSGKRFLLDGKPCMACIGIDITDRRKAEQELRLQSAALNAASQAMIITDRSGTIEWVNSAFVELTGYSADEAIGKNPRVLHKSGVHDESFYRDLWNTILGGRVWRGEMTNRRKDGSLYPEDMSVTPVKDTRGAITHFIAVKRDLTTEKEQEAKFLQSQKMEVVGRLAGGIAHDFNNLLTVINGTAELASMNLREADPLRTDLEEIHRAGSRATSLTRQLLAFSRQQVMKPTVLNVSHQIAGLRSMLRRLIGEDITLVVTAETDDGHVMADAGQLEQMVMNLVVNARDAMPNGGTVTIRTENVELDDAQAALIVGSVKPGPHVRMTIDDTGTGMTEATRRRIFEPFFTTKEQGKGTGLGLATVYGIVTQSGGGIAVKTALGRGSAFSIYLPRVAGVSIPSQSAATAPAARATETILVVEDEDGVRRLVQRMLEAVGYDVLTAGNAAEALLILAYHEQPVHLLFTDIVMPGMSGPDLAARVATMRPELRILFSSGHTDNAALRAKVLDNPAHFIGKPYARAELMRKIRERLDSAPNLYGHSALAVAHN